MIKITELGSTDTVAPYEFQMGKASCKQNQEGHSTRHVRLSRTTCEAEPILTCARM